MRRVTFPAFVVRHPDADAFDAYDVTTWDPADVLLASILDVAARHNVVMQDVTCSNDVLQRFLHAAPHLLRHVLGAEDGPRGRFLGMALVEDATALDQSLARFLVAHGGVVAS
jgi:hypothetical protein